LKQNLRFVFSCARSVATTANATMVARLTYAPPLPLSPGLSRILTTSPPRVEAAEAMGPATKRTTIPPQSQPPRLLRRLKQLQQAALVLRSAGVGAKGSEAPDRHGNLLNLRPKPCLSPFMVSVPRKIGTISESPTSNHVIEK
jgi:hypothetical protein